jgi:hypothetical protein
VTWNKNKQQKWMYLMIITDFLCAQLFFYGPMFGLYRAFINYSPGGGCFFSLFIVRISGSKTYYEVDGQLQNDVQDPRYRDMILYMNKLYREGLIDPEWALNKRETWRSTGWHT